LLSEIHVPESTTSPLPVHDQPLRLGFVAGGTAEPRVTPVIRDVLARPIVAAFFRPLSVFGSSATAAGDGGSKTT
jgi:hypothetical protein